MPRLDPRLHGDDSLGRFEDTSKTRRETLLPEARLLIFLTPMVS